jgi:hypothetical protein
MPRDEKSVDGEGHKNARVSFLLRRVQTGAGAHPAS